IKTQCRSRPVGDGAQAALSNRSRAGALLRDARSTSEQGAGGVEDVGVLDEDEVGGIAQRDEAVPARHARLGDSVAAMLVDGREDFLGEAAGLPAFVHHQYAAAG